MKTLLISIALLSFFTTANAGWWDDAKSKTSEIADKVKDTSVNAYENTKDFVNENSDDVVNTTKKYYKKSKEAIHNATSEETTKAKQ
jgi:polyhydroxyalkanoate synthesis regulator phasin